MKYVERIIKLTLMWPIRVVHQLNRISSCVCHYQNPI